MIILEHRRNEEIGHVNRQDETENITNEDGGEVPSMKT